MAEHEQDGWPENDGLPSADPTPADQGDTPVGATPTDPAATPPADAAPAAPRVPPGFLPQYRYDQVNAAYQQAAQRVSQLEARLQELEAARQDATPAEDEELDEREQRILREMERLFQRSTIFRRLQPLLSKGDDLLRATETVQAQQVAEREHWDTVAQDSVTQTLDGAARELLGADKTAQDLNPYQQQVIAGAFATWVSADPRRVTRYERYDASLSKEFLTEFRGLWGAPPAQLAPAARRAEQAARVRNLPTQGPATAPVGGPPPPKPKFTDEDAVHEYAWTAVQEARRGGR